MSKKSRYLAYMDGLKKLKEKQDREERDEKVGRKSSVLGKLKALQKEGD